MVDLNPMPVRWRNASDHKACDDEGAGTVMVLATVAVAFTLLVALTPFAKAIVAVRVAATGADLVALAAAGSTNLGSTDLAVAPGPCVGQALASAEQSASANRVVLNSCTQLPDQSILVTVSVPVSAYGFTLGRASVPARAGTATSSEPVGAVQPGLVGAGRSRSG